ncbi:MULTISPECIES: membrane protein [Prochlorococcus]|uniref:Predicted membrane protein n=1 Tax=Prochlorococcus marinus (strain SARG / CCMP1375 / SS120) TaxID=167539 RepID=Q7VEC4_PROMA|nr:MULTISPECIES: membrane protein [Prochlorococcus]AAP99135.1 Predicted membrane protein [Prochlorococcus marinus subsp. marinus str. CCMP1375]KGG11596.1 Membrane protein [Prochlorococcus marinus str. LG]KGG22387.1 Membrane protein [Prochlorococcus marinus str. SS2]KGG22723.1 Membrane protein [Prochlorococcus marinus str. SS35]KGG32856.1 Membrane protein [Prochlorococcus marinus str. SS51]
MARWLVAITPIAGAILFPLIVPITISRLGISYGVVVALVLSSLWFVAMLRTSEMPH